MDSGDSVGWAVAAFIFAVAKWGSFFDDNKEAIYGDTLHLPVNCRAYVQASIDGFRSGAYTIDGTMAGLERNCGREGNAWKNKR